MLTFVLLNVKIKYSNDKSQTVFDTNTFNVIIVSFQTVSRDLLHALRKKRRDLYDNIELFYIRIMHPVIALTAGQGDEAKTK